MILYVNEVGTCVGPSANSFVLETLFESSNILEVEQV